MWYFKCLITKAKTLIGKHKAYNLKTKIAVGPDGRACFVGTYYPGLFHDIEIFCIDLINHQDRLDKQSNNQFEGDNLSVNNPGKSFY